MCVGGCSLWTYPGPIVMVYLPLKDLFYCSFGLFFDGVVDSQHILGVLAILQLEKRKLAVNLREMERIDMDAISIIV